VLVSQSRMQITDPGVPDQYRDNRRLATRLGIIDACILDQYRDCRCLVLSLAQRIEAMGYLDSTRKFRGRANGPE